jgi:hypothetical protein
MSKTTRPSTHLFRTFLAVVFAVVAIYIDKLAPPDARAYLQMALWTLTLVAFSIFELRQSLKRKMPRRIAIGLAALHILFLFVIRRLFPLDSSLLILVGLLPEELVFVFLYARIGQSLDPTGPFGPTEEEKRT